MASVGMLLDCDGRRREGLSEIRLKIPYDVRDELRIDLGRTKIRQASLNITYLPGTKLTIIPLPTSIFSASHSTSTVRSLPISNTACMGTNRKETGAEVPPAPALPRGRGAGLALRRLLVSTVVSSGG